jgi:hypothetical protein
MPRGRRQGWVDWRECDARTVLLDDLQSGVLPLDLNVMSAEEAWETLYKDDDAFLNIKFDQFKTRLKDHRKQTAQKMLHSISDLEALRRNRLLHPRQAFNHKGEPIFDLSPAKPLLQQDVKIKTIRRCRFLF